MNRLKGLLTYPEISFVLTSIAIFTFQNLLGPLFSTLLTGLFQNWVMVPSFLGIGLGLWIASFFKNAKKGSDTFAPFVFFISIVAAFSGLLIIHYQIDAGLIKQGLLETPKLIDPIMQNLVTKGLPVIFFSVLPPFIIYGWILHNTFRNSSSPLRIVKLEIITLLIGALWCIFLLESSSLSYVILSIFFFAYAAVFFSKVRKRVLLIIGGLVLIPSVIFSDSFEFQRDKHLIVRDFKRTSQVKLLETEWKSFSKIQLYELISKDYQKIHYYIAIGDGSGMARLYDYNGTFDNVRIGPRTVKAALAQDPKSVLVLFAGAGSELVEMHALKGNNIQTTGIEINDGVVNMAMNFNHGHLRNFFSNFNSKLIVSENRRFLETSDQKFDSILYSWSGATVAHYSGAILHTTHYSFTKEAFLSAIHHLNPNGVISFFGGSKWNTLMTLRKLGYDGEIEDFKNRILVLGQKDVEQPHHAIFYRNGAWTEDAIRKTEESIKDSSYEVAYKPGDASETFWNRIINSTPMNLPDIRRDMWMKTSIFPNVITDNHPYGYKQTASFINKHWLRVLTREGITWEKCFLFLLLLVVIITMQTVETHSSLMNSHFVSFLAWAPFGSALNLFFLFKGILFLGNPTWAFLLVMTMSQMGSVIGATLAEKYDWTRNQKLFLFLMAASFTMSLIWLLTSLLPFKYSVMSYIIFVGAGIFLVNVLLSAFFLLGFKKQKEVELAWAIETLFSGICTFLGAILIEEETLTYMLIVLGSITLIFLLSGTVAQTLKKVK